VTAKELIVGSTIVLSAAFTAATGTSSTTLAQGYYGYHHRYHHHWYGHRYHGLYSYYGGPVALPDVVRGGPGPRVQAGSGMGIGAVR
jgi:hypothetical protein